ncbi:piggyBac transposable element-derived protein 4-like [Argopecten irradians]|uniref:piggyBac transposable element-derived protein 4-like n=1 Tax=Argopecten irradians TaxID=31199 RepID=UPI003716B999
MSRDRFMNVMSFFHLCDNNTAVQRGLDGYSPLQKLGRPYTDILKSFENCYNPGRNIAIDEGMIPWRGKLNFRVYSPDKPIKYGLKMYMLCDSANGYCSRLELYTGREGVQLDCSGNGSTYYVVMRLMEPNLNKGHHLYTDNYYSSPQLFYDLFMNATLACGTLRSNRRGVPKAMKEAHPTKGEISVFNNGTLVALKYADKKDVSFLTTIHEGVMVYTGKRDHDGNRIVRPDCVLSYNKYIGAVDRCDQMVSYNGFDRRTLKWWKKVFFHILGIAVLNSYIIYKEMSQHPVLQRVFRREVVRQLVMEADVTGPESRGRKKGDNLQRLSARHLIGHLPPTGTKSPARRRCVPCGPGEMELYRAQHQGLPAPRRLGRETTFQCKQCCVPLCVEPCFELYHTKAEFVLAYKRLRLTTQPGQEE